MAGNPRSGARVIEPDRKVTDLLDVLRQHLAMDATALAIWLDGQLVIQLFAGDGRGFGLTPGTTVRGGDELYRDVVEGRVPALSNNVDAEGRSRDSTVLNALGVGAYVLAALTDPRDERYGLLCCLAHGSCPGLHDRHRQFVDLIVTFLRDSLLDLRQIWQTRSQIWSRISDLIDAGGPKIAFQPIVRLGTGEIVGLEALARFPPGGHGAAHSTEDWFREARLVGLGSELDLAALGRAAEALPRLPKHLKLAVNSTPSTFASGLVTFVRDLPNHDQLIIEITEQETYPPEPGMLLAVSQLRELGVRIAIDDAGTGYSGLEKLVQLRPDVIKIDQVLTRGVDRDPARRAIITGLVRLAGELGGVAIAEGIESRAERDAMISAGVRYGQGYYLGRPSSTPLPAAPVRVGAGLP